MARKRSSARFLLDTSAVVHHSHGHTLQQAAVREAVAAGEVVVPVFLVGVPVVLLPSLAELTRRAAAQDVPK
jgi:hypothetical protein